MEGAAAAKLDRGSREQIEERSEEGLGEEGAELVQCKGGVRRAEMLTPPLSFHLKLLRPSFLMSD